MNLLDQIHLRHVAVADLDDLFEHQCDPVACQMAAFPPRDREAFMTHWAKIMANAEVVARTIVVGDKVSGNVVCWQRSGELLVGYWLGRHFWGRGVATRALTDVVSLIPTRPLRARVAKQNLASIRVLEKCGFRVTGEDRAATPTGGDAVDELIYALVE